MKEDNKNHDSSDFYTIIMLILHIHMAYIDIFIVLPYYVHDYYRQLLAKLNSKNNYELKHF